MEVLPLGYFKVRWVFRCAGIADAMGFSLAFAPRIDGNTAGDVATSMLAIYDQAGLWTEPTSSVDYTYESIEVTQMLADGPFTAVNAQASNGSGSNLPVPANCAVLIRKLTGLGGATNRGRIYWPPYQVTEGNVTAAGYLTPASTNSFTDRWEAFHAACNVVDLNPVLLHSDPAEEPTPILGFAAQSLLATQRRRMR